MYQDEFNALERRTIRIEETLDKVLLTLDPNERMDRTSWESEESILLRLDRMEKMLTKILEGLAENALNTAQIEYALENCGIKIERKQ